MRFFFEREVRAYRWAAVVVGLLGVLIVSWPRLTLIGNPDTSFTRLALGALAVIGSAAFAAGAMIQIRRLIGKEPAITIVIYFTVISALMSFICLPLAGLLPETRQLFVLVMAGIGRRNWADFSDIIVQVCGCFDDCAIRICIVVISLAVGMVCVSDVPTSQMLVGAIIVVGAGLFIIWREHRLGLERKTGAKQAQSL